MSGINRDEWLKALAEVGEGLEHDPDAITTDEFATMFGMHRCTAERRLALLVAEGKAIRTFKRTRVASNNRVMQLVAYRLIQSPTSDTPPKLSRKRDKPSRKRP
jgi:hypothetical protein